MMIFMGKVNYKRSAFRAEFYELQERRVILHELWVKGGGDFCELLNFDTGMGMRRGYHSSS
jgi:hypothetical protein